MAIMYQLYIYDAHENIVAKIEEDPKSAVFLFIKMRNIFVLQKKGFLILFLIFQWIIENGMLVEDMLNIIMK